MGWHAIQSNWILRSIKNGNFSMLYSLRFKARDYVTGARSRLDDQNKEGKVWSGNEMVNLVRFIRIAIERNILDDQMRRVFEAALQNALRKNTIAEGVLIYQEMVAAGLTEQWSFCDWNRVLFDGNGKTRTISAKDWEALKQHLPYLQHSFNPAWLRIQATVVELGQFDRLCDLYPKGPPRDLAEEMARVETTPSNFANIVQLHIHRGDWSRIWQLSANPQFEDLQSIALGALAKAEQLMLRPQEAKTESSTPANSAS